MSESLLTVDELAAATGLTVRTTRYYASLGLIPPPIKRGRVAYYDASHRARLELIRALQDHGFTLTAIESYLSRIPLDASVEELVAQRAVLRPWQTATRPPVSRAGLDELAGRTLSDDDLEWLLATVAIRQVDDGFEPQSSFRLAVDSLELDIPVESIVEADAAIGRHMEALVDELTDILRRQVVAPFRDQPRESKDPIRFEHTVARLRQLTLEAVVGGFQRAANQVISRSLSR